jgi:hypothetical protein
VFHGRVFAYNKRQGSAEVLLLLLLLLVLFSPFFPFFFLFFLNIFSGFLLQHFVPENVCSHFVCAPFFVYFACRRITVPERASFEFSSPARYVRMVVVVVVS